MSRSGARILLRSTTRNARRLWTGTALIAVHQACETFVPIMIGVIVDRAVMPGDGGQLLLWIGVLAVQFTVLTTAYRFGARRLMSAIAEEGHQLRLEVSAKILHPRGVRTDLRAGDLLTVSTSDADNTSYLLDYIPRVAGAVVATVISAVALFLISVPLGLVVLIATPVVLVLLQISSPLITKRVADQQEQAGRATSLATDLVTGLRPLRGIGAQDAAADRYREVSRRSLRATLRASRTQGGYLAASTTLSTLLACGIAILAGWFALTGRISVGEFITVIGLAQFLIEPFGTLAVVPSWIAEARASADRVALITDAGLVLPQGVAEPAEHPCDLRLAGVSHGPLDGLDLHVRPGEFVGVVARRSGDADALVKLLSVPAGHRGRVLLGGSPLEEVERSHARRLLLVEPHHPDLFTGTIAANVAVHAEAAEGLLAEALSAAAADEVLATRPDGLDAVVAERGASLSGGQRQRIALARALLARPPVLVLHDPTTAVDAVTEHAIAQGIRALRHGPGAGFATVVITSSPALLAATDRVIVLGDGAVTAEGEHAVLGENDETYRRLVLR
ncbi:ABC transporter ATP-binding protein [Actinoplanes friuliensis]|uniref:Putative ABC transporter ATPase and permease protein n=1 Tax=Actinoplanes friuliensis DSM 7358 TaxID=1246995 RepID=U5VSM3_9ACTN|nr:ABC transporter ATP-binding protein [Actinoplanes friuliensis]AGZ39864.1 putative ABC transporter ATPase and permease protein [Actinoplanes friuliensis DSM 7358]